MKKALDTKTIQGRKSSIVFGDGYQFLGMMGKALELGVDEVQLGFNVVVDNGLERMNNGFFPTPIDVIG